MIRPARPHRLIPLVAAALTLAVMAPAPAGSADARIDFAGDGVIRGDLGPAGGDPRATARSALERYARRLGVDADAFVFDSVRRSIVGTHVRGAERRNGVRVDVTSAAVHLVGGRIWQVEARGSDLPGAPVPAPVPSGSAAGAALGRTGVTRPTHAPVVQRVLTARGSRLADVWRVSVFSLKPAVAVEVDVSAATGRVLAMRDSAVHADGQATVFDPNATVVMQNKSYRQPGVDESGADTDLDSPELTAALSLLPIREFNSQEVLRGRLLGPYVDVQGPAPLDINGGFFYSRGDPRFETTMAYAHLDRLQRHFQALGFTGAAAVNAEPQNVYTLPVYGFDNSFFQPGQDLILYGNGGVDDAEDAEVIVHEYGHAVHHAQVAGWGATHEGGSMGEGFGDFLAAAYFAGSISKGFQDTCVADWDATSYSSADPPCLRRTDTNKRYPQNITGGVHADGEIWSRFLWDLRGLLRCPAEPPEDDPDWDTDPECRTPRNDDQIMSDRVLKMVLTSHEFLSSTADFGDAVAALRTAASALGRPDWDPLVTQAAQARGLPLS